MLNLRTLIVPLQQWRELVTCTILYNKTTMGILPLLPILILFFSIPFISVISYPFLFLYSLPQKSGFPQEKINEIHGAWYDPSNPVVQFSGSLRGDLFNWMIDMEKVCFLKPNNLKT
jgi:hypothetical protein